MDLKDYQKFCNSKRKPKCDTMCVALGLGGETGEVLEILKKSRRDETPIDIEHLKEELGDVLWYVANLCNDFNLTLDQVIEHNVVKLNKRYKGE